MSDYRDIRGSAYAHANEFGNPGPPKCKTKRPRTRRRNAAQMCDRSRYQDQTKNTLCPGSLRKPPMAPLNKDGAATEKSSGDPS